MTHGNAQNDESTEDMPTVVVPETHREEHAARARLENLNSAARVRPIQGRDSQSHEFAVYL